MTRPSARPAPAAQPPLGRVALVGALAGAVSGLWLVLLQNLAARVAGMLWTVDAPWLNFVLYALAGMLGGALGALLIEAARRWLTRSRDAWLWLAAGLGVGPYAALVLTYTAMVGSAGLRPTRLLLLAAHAAFALLLARVAGRVLRGRVGGPGRALAGALAWMLPTLAAAYFANLAWIAQRTWRVGLDRPALFSWLTVCAAVTVGALIAATLASRRLRPLGAVLCLGLVGTGLWLQRVPPPELGDAPPSGPNVLLIILDTLRRDAVSAYGIVDDTTPHLDRFAAEGVLWEDAISPAGWTLPGHASLFTGAQVSRHGAGHEHFELRPEPGGAGTGVLPTLAESFSERGWRTVGFSANAQLNRTFGFHRGFTEYYEIWRARKGDFDALGRLLRETGWSLGVVDRGGDRVTRGYVDWLRAHGGERPWFAFLNMTEPHSPYDAPEPWLHRFVDEPTERNEVVAFASRASEFKYGGASEELAQRLWGYYLGAVAYQDHLVGRILDRLAEQGLDTETLVFITSDHGENFGWRGQLYHGTSLSDALLRIPLIARGPGIPAGVRESAPVSLIDIFPTLLQLTGGEPLPADAGRPGRVMPPIGPDLPPDRERLAEKLSDLEESPAEFIAANPDVAPQWVGEQSALFKGDWTVTWYGGLGPPELTRLAGPPRPPVLDGRTPVDDPETLAALLARLEELRASWPDGTSGESASIEQLDEETIRQLEALGYL